MTPVEFRRHLHADPELSFEEHRTARFITAALEAEGIECRTVAGTGVLAIIEGVQEPHKAVVLRADTDALPINEQTECEWRSRNEGVMHACGHDVHAATLFGVLQRIKYCGALPWTVIALFQPGEECNPGGALKVLSENPFAGYDVRAVIAQHVEPNMAVGCFGFCAGKFMAANDELRFTVCGKGGHAAMRPSLKDPVQAAAELITELLSFNGSDSVVSIGRVQADGATNVIPDSVYLEGTMRTFDEELRRTIKSGIADVAARIDARCGTSTSIDINEGYPCVVNDLRLTDIARELAAERFAAAELPPRATSEDFGRFCHIYPSLLYRSGAGVNSGGTHTPYFNPDEQAVNVDVDFMYMLAEKVIAAKF
ncbi:MAG: amidohydrolase [Alistipes sp.]|nr:amidohydrolase [Alistipes sp.]